jgi:hypothetical protein
MPTITSKSQKRTNIDNGHWEFDTQLDHQSAFGFVYVIKENPTGMMYIGKKLFRGTGKINKGRQSNWRSYTSSSRDLNRIITESGKDNFRFYVLEQYYTRGGLSWAETWSQCNVEVPSNNHIWYNRFIDKVQWRSTEHISNKHKSRLKKIINA